MHAAITDSSSSALVACHHAERCPSSRRHLAPGPSTLTLLITHIHSEAEDHGFSACFCSAPIRSQPKKHGWQRRHVGFWTRHRVSVQRRGLWAQGPDGLQWKRAERIRPRSLRCLAPWSVCRPALESPAAKLIASSRVACGNQLFPHAPHECARNSGKEGRFPSPHGTHIKHTRMSRSKFYTYAASVFSWMA